MSKWATQPTNDEVLDAILGGYNSVDDGEGFWPGFDNSLTLLGYQYSDDSPCSCPDDGAHGHMPECGWLREWPVSRKPGVAAAGRVRASGLTEAFADPMAPDSAQRKQAPDR